MSAEQPRFLNLAEVLYLHDESLARFGGSPGIREPGLVESALGSAQNAYWYGHGGLFDIAAAYAFHIAESQAFVESEPLLRRRSLFCESTVCLFRETTVGVSGNDRHSREKIG